MTVHALMFPGQGSQKVTMGKALCDSFPSARRIFEEADEALGESLSGMCFEGPEEALALTANTQPAILTTSIAAYTVLKEEVGIEPAVCLGHSLGEFSALVAVGALRFADAVKLVRLRGQAMQEAVPAGVGGMAAVMGMDMEAVEALCKEAREAVEGDDTVLAPANENGGGQVVVAGHATAVQHAVGLAKERKARAIPLKVSAPFHCALMAPAAKRLEEALEAIEIGAMSSPVVANVDAEPNSDPGRVKGLLVQQVTGRVRWESSVRKLLHMGVQEGLEVGHGKVLAGLVKRITRDLPVKPFGSPDDISVLKVDS